MEFYSVRDFRMASKAVWESLARGGEVVITNDGKPAALMIEIPEGGFPRDLSIVSSTIRLIRKENYR